MMKDIIYLLLDEGWDGMTIKDYINGEVEKEFRQILEDAEPYC